MPAAAGDGSYLNRLESPSKRRHRRLAPSNSRKPIRWESWPTSSPREGKFFEYFNQHADRIAEASRELTLLLSEYSNEPARAGRVERINDLEHKADRITHETASALLQTIFVTPIDRDDIHRLISRMDDVLDLMQDAAESLVPVRRATQVTEPRRSSWPCCCRTAASGCRPPWRCSSSMKNAPEILRLCREIDNHGVATPTA
jgi:hypothetical protein